ncbi:hypothetical protein B0H14DRAFT_3424031 [Mycena olivaceomarginata]|nr:hypothetical protein B0H14DRAFT_3424031 [Mycena olivaceomarginata]
MGWDTKFVFLVDYLVPAVLTHAAAACCLLPAACCPPPPLPPAAGPLEQNVLLLLASHVPAPHQMLVYCSVLACLAPVSPVPKRQSLFPVTH